MKIIECPRDAMQGWRQFIPTDKKIEYINHLLTVGFDTIDFGSFVSPKAIPQMRDTVEVLKGLDLSTTSSKLLAIVANLRGAEDACQFEEIDYLGFPLSISETFQQRNTNKSIAEALAQLAEIQNVCQKNGKVLVTYISMGFGNPYGEPFNEQIVGEFVQTLVDMEVSVVSLADTIGVANPKLIDSIFTTTINDFPSTEIGAHFHSTPQTAIEKIEAAYNAGCIRFDGAIKGYGGCPMAKDDLTGNIATEVLIEYLGSKDSALNLDSAQLQTSIQASASVFL